MLSNSNSKHSLREIAAYHEAGHAVMFFLLHYEVESLSIDHLGNGFTKCPMRFPSVYVLPQSSSVEQIGADADKSNKSHLWIKFRKYALVNYAGYCAEFKFQKKNMPFGLCCLDNTENDISKIKSEVEKVNALYGKVIFGDICFYFWCKEAKYIIRKSKVWETIVNLAEALLNSTEGILDSNSIAAILKKRLKPFDHSKWE